MAVLPSRLSLQTGGPLDAYGTMISVVGRSDMTASASG